MNLKKYLLIFLLTMANIVNAEPLLPNQAFQLIGKLENKSIIIYGSTQPEYKLYKDSIKIINNKSKIKLGDLIKPQGKKEFNEFLNKYQEEYEGDFLLEIPIIGNKKGEIDFEIEAQGCTKGLCYSPFTTHIKIQ